MSRRFDKHWLYEGVARQMRRQAEHARCYDGLATPENLSLLNFLTGYHVATGTRLIFTRDAGYHSSGWWKNPQYERCWHLSLSFLDPLTGKPRPKDVQLTHRWIEAFYGDDKRYVWAESPYSPEGKDSEVWHYRVFCDPAWQPIVPHGEVYGREFTEAGWLSYSDLHDEHARMLARLEPLPGEQ